MIPFRVPLIVIALLSLPGRAEGLVVRLLSSDDNSYMQRIGSNLEALLRHAEAPIRVESGNGGPLPKGVRRLTVTVGMKAWRSQAAESGGEGAVLAVAPTRAAFEELRPRMSGPVGVIYMDMPPGRFFNLIQTAMPQRTAVGMLASVGTLVGPQSAPQLGRFEASAAERGLRLVSDKVNSEAEVGPAIERLVRQSSVFLAIPDPLVHTVNTVQPLLLLTYRANVPVIGYSESYLKAGAILALYATPEQIAQQALETILAYRQGKAMPPTQTARYFTVRINDTVARSLGIALPQATELEERLRQMRD
ncbi:hypothetical protein B9N43_04050 [Denitratisoma sp. DHT3]|uniref:ABC transporter substrate-binding protein n=1 Tax=Denitratisoma sp. DHT3 TaxID=1981880 RepID=UPI001198BE93|nr:ABC transporter substrate binding protein [Denitratisoma sp. DHT3]QDX80496.1 hypothetical protein B9N43_04050 [Denitratisoma sp. DHT3]